MCWCCLPKIINISPFSLKLQLAKVGAFLRHSDARYKIGDKVEFNTVDFVESRQSRLRRFGPVHTGNKVDRVEFNFVASVYTGLNIASTVFTAQCAHEYAKRCTCSAIFFLSITFVKSEHIVKHVHILFRCHSGFLTSSVVLNFSWVSSHSKHQRNVGIKIHNFSPIYGMF